MEEPEFDPKEAERKELDLITGRGMYFDVKKRFTGIFSKKKTRRFTIYSPPVGVMDRLSAEFLELDLDEELLQQQNIESIKEAKRVVGKHALRMARIVAIAVLNNSPYYSMLVNFLTGYFFMRVDSAMLLKLAMIINTQNNYADFINSIRYLSATRTTKPQTAEPQRIEDQDDSED